MHNLRAQSTVHEYCTRTVPLPQKASVQSIPIHLSPEHCTVFMARATLLLRAGTLYCYITLIPVISHYSLVIDYDYE